jgi:hypothetical protein
MDGIRKSCLNSGREIIGSFLYSVVDPGCFIRDPEKIHPDPGVKKAPDPGSGSATLLLKEFTVFSTISVYYTELEERHRPYITGMCRLCSCMCC